MLISFIFASFQNGEMTYFFQMNFSKRSRNAVFSLRCFPREISSHAPGVAQLYEGRLALT